MTGIDVRTHGRTLCFKCPGGRIGAGRFKAFVDLFEDLSDLRVMLSRRQALAVHGSFMNLPSYLLDELSADDITDSNVKCFPFKPGSSLMHWVIDELSELSDLGPALTLSYSTDETYRGLMRRDDFTLVRLGEREFRLDSNLWGTSPRTLLEPVEIDDLPVLIDALKSLFRHESNSRRLEERTPRDLKSRIMRAINRTDVDAGPDSPPNQTVSRVDESLDETSFLGAEDGEASTIHRSSDDVHWIILPLAAGIIPGELVKVLLSVIQEYNVKEMRFTPEQNILLPLGGRPEGKDARQRFSCFNTVPSRPHFLPRISTCPGSRFCSNVQTNPVKLTRRLQDYLGSYKTCVRLNHRFPIGITGCGDTRSLERLHPIGLYPHENGQYKISIGGQFDEVGQPGREISGGFHPNEIPRLIRTIFEIYDESAISNFSDWAYSEAEQLPDELHQR